MLIWAILLASFVGGIVVILKGSLKVSQRRQMVGVAARRVGLCMVLLPFVVFATLLGVMMASQAFGNTSETAVTHGHIAAVFLISLAAILLAANAKRWSVPMRVDESRPNTSSAAGGHQRPDFSFLEDPSPETQDTGGDR
ncbi:MAG: hypothetical protein EA381_16425 [Planctomycetaceae bacterium]|nr:MAG: hypothetical protein EA381_16425 [Planctomycetaceae bacterium]